MIEGIERIPKVYKDIGKIDGQETHEWIRGITHTMYGSERPLTLPRVFIRKFMDCKKSSVCMQIRRTPEDAKHILENLYLGEQVDPAEIQPTAQKPCSEG